MDYVGFMVFAIAVPLGYLLEFTLAYMYVGWTVCRKNNLVNPINLSFTTSLMIALATLFYLEPSIEAIAGLLVGFSFEFGYDYARWFDKLDNLREECLVEKSRLDKSCRECYTRCLDKCKHVELKD